MKKMILVAETAGRKIYADEPHFVPYAKGLHRRLEEFCDIKGVAGKVEIVIGCKNDQVLIEVDRDCYYKEGNKIISKRACALGLMNCMFSDLTWVFVPDTIYNLKKYVWSDRDIIQRCYSDLKTNIRECHYFDSKRQETYELAEKLSIKDRKSFYHFID